MVNEGGQQFAAIGESKDGDRLQDGIEKAGKAGSSSEKKNVHQRKSWTDGKGWQGEKGAITSETLRRRARRVGEGNARNKWNL